VVAPTRETEPERDRNTEVTAPETPTAQRRGSEEPDGAQRVHDELAVVSGRVLMLQFALTLGLAGIVLFIDSGKILAVAYGGSLAIGSTLLSRRSVIRAARAAVQAPQLGLVPVYLGLVNKFLIVGGGLALGLIVLGLSPLYVVAGYLVSQLALVIVLPGLRRGA